MALSLYESKESDFAGVDPLSRIFILNIPTHVDNEVLKQRFEKYGDVEVYTCHNCENDKGWAFVGFKSKRSVRRLICRILKKQESA